MNAFEKIIDLLKGRPFLNSFIFAVTGMACLVLFYNHATVRLQEFTVETAANDYAQMIKSFRATYTQLVVENIRGKNGFNAQLKKHNIRDRSGKYIELAVTHDFDTKSYPHNGAIPLPITLTFRLGKKIGELSKNGMEMALVSAMPFPWRERERYELAIEARRKKLGVDPNAQASLDKYKQDLQENWKKWKEADVKDPDVGKMVFMDDFQRKAWDTFSRYSQADLDANKPYAEWLKGTDGTKTLRFATPDILQDGCVSCHNLTPGTPSVSWRPSQLRGVLAIKIPLQANVGKMSRTLTLPIIIMFVILVLCTGLMGVSLNMLRKSGKK